MKRKRYTEEQIIGIMKEQESDMRENEMLRKHGHCERHFLQMKKQIRPDGRE